MLVVGISLLIHPELIIGWIEDNMENTSVYVSAIIVRLILGIFFKAVASSSKYPVVVYILPQCLAQIFPIPLWHMPYMKFHVFSRCDIGAFKIVLP